MTIMTPVVRLAIALLAIGFSTADASRSSAPIDARIDAPNNARIDALNNAQINAVIGDLSFVDAFGRAPTPADDPALRIRTHLAYVERVLRGADVDGLTADQRARRARSLDRLRAYRTAGRFPAAETQGGGLPIFIDRGGARCAVGYLFEQDSGADAVHAIDRRYHNALIAAIDAPDLVRWATRAGLSRDELALIQPTYPPNPLGGRAIELRLAAEYGNMVGGSDGEIVHEGLMRAGVRRIFKHNYYVGSPVVRLDGAAGWMTGGNAAYAAHLQIGSQVNLRRANVSGLHLIGATAGIGIDAIGDRIPRAWTIPVDAYWHYHVGSGPGFGVITGPRFAVAGADRGLGWRGALEIVLRNARSSGHVLTPRDVRLELGVEHVADATFLQLAIGVAARSRFGYWED